MSPELTGEKSVLILVFSEVYAVFTPLLFETYDAPRFISFILQACSQAFVQRQNWWYDIRSSKMDEVGVVELADFYWVNDVMYCALCLCEIKYI